MQLDYSDQIELDLTTVVPSLAGPRRPQDRVPLTEAKAAFRAEMANVGRPASAPSWVDEASQESFPASDPDTERPPEPAASPAATHHHAQSNAGVEVMLDGQPHHIDHGAVAIAAITSCTNTSNPQVMVAAGLLARNAARRGVTRRPWVKTTLSPGSKVVMDYLQKAGRRPPYFDHLSPQPGPVADIDEARILVKLGDSVTTDHISPAGAITPDSDAGRYLTGLRVSRCHLNTFASRRGNHEVIVRGAFANVRLRNQVAPGTIGGWTRCFDAGGEVQRTHDAALTYRAAGTPLVVVAGRDYGAGSSRDWAAKGPRLLGVRAVLAESFERIHRSNLIGMGVLPLQFLPGDTAESLGLAGEERISIQGIPAVVEDPSRRHVEVSADRRRFRMVVRLDTRREADYYRNGGVLPYVLRALARPDDTLTRSG